MKVELQYGDTIAIPEGCKAIVKDGCVVIEKAQEFKDGDILTHMDYQSYPFPFIYKGTDERGFYLFYVGIDCIDEIYLPDEENTTWGNGTLRYATEEEKQELFDKLKKEGLRWNAEEKRVEKIKWKAEYGKGYFGIGSQGDLVAYTADGSRFDENLHELGNYFRTKEQAEEAVKRIKEVLRKYHEEIGE